MYTCIKCHKFASIGPGTCWKCGAKLIKKEPRTSVETDIVQEVVRQANSIGALQQQTVGRASVDNKQYKYITANVGELYPHPRDSGAWTVHDKDTDVHTFLPGYATGDRYTAILTMLIDQRLCLSIAYQEGNEREEKDAKLAYDTVLSALKLNDIDTRGRVCLLSHNGGLKAAREHLNSTDGRSKYTAIKGGGSPLLSTHDLSQHVYHISITTVIMALFWGEDYSKFNLLESKSRLVRHAVYSMLKESSKFELDALARRYIREKKITTGSVGLWVANRPRANAREAEAISNPIMFEQIKAAIEASGRSCFYIADGFQNIIDGKIENRHKFNPHNTPDIGKFWGTNDLFRERENQWFFIDRLMKHTNCSSLIGIRSGALEPIALLGHNVIYLEHDDMFTPERHGAWQGRIPYSRLVIRNRVGYYDNEATTARGGKPLGTNVIQTEVVRDRAKKQLLENFLQKRLVDNPEIYGDFWRNHHNRFPVPLAADNNPALQESIASVDEQISEGVLLPREIEILLAMIDKKSPAFRVL
ncbi:hypothetical protein EYS14_05210 [Alteromonadaceae bacterium M269]|nr:hypothetical protein EYS14_05210 [Alteromonadaceae bacterium M269]